MSRVEGSTRPATVDGANASGAPPLGSPDDDGLLPAPSASVNVDELLATLQAMMAKEGENKEATGRVRAKATDEAHQKSIKENLDATRRQIEEQPHGPGFFGSIGEVIKDVVHNVATLHFADLVSDTADNVSAAVDSKKFWSDVGAGATEIAKWGAVAASVAVAIMTCGAGTAGTVAVVLAVVSASMSAAGAAESEAHLLEHAGLDEKTDGWVSMGMSLCGAVAGGAGAVAAGAQMSAAQAGSLAERANEASTGVEMASAAGEVVGAGAGVAVSTFEAREEQAKVDVMSSRMKEQWLARAITEVVEELGESKKADDKTSGLLNGAVQTNQTTTQQCASWRA